MDRNIYSLDHSISNDLRTLEQLIQNLMLHYTISEQETPQTIISWELSVRGLLDGGEECQHTARWRWASCYWWRRARRVPVVRGGVGRADLSGSALCTIQCIVPFTCEALSVVHKWNAVVVTRQWVIFYGFCSGRYCTLSTYFIYVRVCVCERARLSHLLR